MYMSFVFVMCLFLPGNRLNSCVFNYSYFPDLPLYTLAHTLPRRLSPFLGLCLQHA